MSGHTSTKTPQGWCVEAQQVETAQVRSANYQHKPEQGCAALREPRPNAPN